MSTSNPNVTALDPYRCEGYVDCHNHMLPGIDDGAHDLDMTIAMAERAVSSGIDTVVCTPHHMNGVFRNFRATVLELVAETNAQVASAGYPLRMLPGSELHLVPELPSQVAEGEALTFGDHGKAVLVELPTRTIPAGAEAILERLAYEGFTPVIAHPERNAALAADPERAIEWTTWGCKLQLTAMSCSGRFGKPIQQICKTWVRGGHAHLIASDAHRPRGRAPDLTGGIEALRQWAGDDVAELLARENPRRLASGEDLLKPPSLKGAEPKRKSGKGMLSRLFGHR